MHLSKLLFFVLFLLLCFNSEGKIRMASIFSDNMVLQQQSDVRVWGWSTPGSRVTLSCSWTKNSYSTRANQQGQWQVTLSTHSAGGPYTMTVSDGKALTLTNIMIGEVWLCSGQSNMEMPMKGFLGQPVTGSNMIILKSGNNRIRMLTVPRNSKAEPVDSFKANWVEAAPETVAEFSATGYYFGKLLNEMLDVPVGLINVSFGGSCIQAWMSKETTVDFEDKKIPESDDAITRNDRNRFPSVLFNGMLSPVIGYGIRGAIWYQGETNYKESVLYEQLFPSMVADWRTRWGIGEFPFYYCQIAPFDYSRFNQTDNKPEYNSAFLRDAQRKCAGIIPNSAMAVLMDCADFDNIHPADKDKAGERLALLALSSTYGLKGFASASPEYKAIEINGSTVTVSFDHVPNGITSFGHDVTAFELAGEDKIFYQATAFVRGKSVILSSPRVKEPVAVRYAWKDYIKAEIFNTEGLPLSSFRTDDW